MKIHITLVGGQPAPVYNGIVAIKPDRVVFIYSAHSYGVVEKLRTVVNIEEDKQLPLSETDPGQILQRIEHLKEKYKSDSITLNISGGLKSWSHLFGCEFEKMPNAAVIYIDQNNFVWNYRTMECSSFNFDMKTLFNLYGNPLADYKRFLDYTEDDYKVCLQLKNIYLNNKFRKEFRDLMSVVDAKDISAMRFQSQGMVGRYSSSYAEWRRTAEGSAVDVHLNNRTICKDFCVESKYAMELAFNAHWLEYLVAHLLSAWPQSSDILLNCRFTYSQEIKNGNSKNIDKNEVDIIVNAGSKLLFVECKTNLYNHTDIDKFSAVVRTYGGTASKALFISYGKLSKIAQQKCAQYGMMYFSIEENANYRDALYKLLNAEMGNINVK